MPGEYHGLLLNFELYKTKDKKATTTDAARYHQSEQAIYCFVIFMKWID